MLRRLTTRLYDNAYLLLSCMALCWAGNQVLGRAVAGHIPPITYSFLRWSLATVIDCHSRLRMCGAIGR